MSACPPPVERVVKPRKAGATQFPVIAICDGGILIDRTGEYYPITQLAQVIVTEPASLIVGSWMGEHILHLHEAFQGNTDFQFRLSPVYRDPIGRNGKKGRATLRDTVVTLLGFKGKYHHPIDPSSFIGKTIDELDKSPEPELIRLMNWGKRVAAFCKDNDISPKASSGGLASQLLKDPRFYPADRRKAPRLLNDKVRKQLPGNYYDLITPAKKATYLDMSNAHHYLATQIQFPCANDLHGYGNLNKPKEWARPGTNRYNEAIKSIGLLHVRLSTPHIPPGSFPPPYMRKQGQQNTWIYTNEIPYIETLGGRIEHVYGGIYSRKAEKGLNRFAEWAIKELEDRAQDRQWLKPTLHSVYGVLAAKPRAFEIGWRQTSKGEHNDIYPMGNKMIPVTVVKGKKPVDYRVTNVLHRGMIEAEQRTRTLQLATQLQKQGGKIICIYADSIFVHMPQLPILPPPWRAKADLMGLHFRSATHFESPQMTRLPGIPRRRRSASSVRTGC